MKKLSLSIILLLILLASHKVEAVSLFFDPLEGRIESEEEFSVDFFLDTEGELLNALEGTLEFPSKLLRVDKISTEGSVINFWIKEPTSRGNRVEFAGIVPGGFDGVRHPLDEKRYPGLLFTIVFKAHGSGEGAIIAQSISALKNDGLGGAVETDLLPFALTVFGGANIPLKFAGLIFLITLFILVMKISHPNEKI